MADAAAGRRLLCHVVCRPLQTPVFVRAKDPTHDEQPVAVKLVDLILGKHRTSRRSRLAVSDLRAEATYHPSPQARAGTDVEGYDSVLVNEEESGSLHGLLEAGIHTSGLMRRQAPRVLPVHELIVVQAGMLPIAEEDRRFQVRRDEWVLLRAGRRHFSYEDLNRETWFYWVCFGGGSPDAQGVE